MRPSLAHALVSLVATTAACRIFEADTDDTAATPDTACGHSCCGFESSEYSDQISSAISEEDFAFLAGPDGELTVEECGRICTRDVGPDPCGVSPWYDEFAFKHVDACAITHDACGVIATCDATFETYCEGRDHAWIARRPRARPGAAGWLARAAEAEAASVLAFRAVADELRGHGAPAALVRDLRRAARDEAHHARVMRDLATRSGGRPAPVRRVRGPARPLVDVAIENAVEGCVGETFAATIALWQAAHAEDPRVAAAMREIAQDEVRHAALAVRVAAFCARRLTPSERDRVATARAAALGRLAWRAPAAGLAARLGLPDDHAGAALVAGVRRLAA